MYDPRSVRPRRDWVVVLDDQRKEKLASGLLLPSSETGLEKVTEGSGTIVRIGVGNKVSQLGLEPGSRVVYRSYLKYANPIENDEKWPDGGQKRYFLMSCEDLVAVTQPGVEVGVYSGRPMVPEKGNDNG